MYFVGSPPNKFKHTQVGIKPSKTPDCEATLTRPAFVHTLFSSRAYHPLPTSLTLYNHHFTALCTLFELIETILLLQSQEKRIILDYYYYFRISQFLTVIADKIQ